MLLNVLVKSCVFFYFCLDAHGNVQVSKIESERLVQALVEAEMAKRKKQGTYKGSLSLVPHFLGYEGVESKFANVLLLPYLCMFLTVLRLFIWLC